MEGWRETMGGKREGRGGVVVMVVSGICFCGGAGCGKQVPRQEVMVFCVDEGCV